MTNSSPVNSLLKARRHYTAARTLLWNTHGTLTRMNIDQEHLLRLQQALLDNQTSIDYLNDIIRNLHLAAARPPFSKRRSITHAGT